MMLFTSSLMKKHIFLLTIDTLISKWWHLEFCVWSLNEILEEISEWTEISAWSHVLKFSVAECHLKSSTGKQFAGFSPVGNHIETLDKSIHVHEAKLSSLALFERTSAWKELPLSTFFSVWFRLQKQNTLRTQACNKKLIVSCWLELPCQKQKQSAKWPSEISTEERKKAIK